MTLIFFADRAEQGEDITFWKPVHPGVGRNTGFKTPFCELSGPSAFTKSQHILNYCTVAEASEPVDLSVTELKAFLSAFCSNNLQQTR